MNNSLSESIILVTESFPYSACSETFLLDEIEFLGKNQLYSVSIFALSPKTITPQYLLPSNLTSNALQVNLFSYLFFLPISFALSPSLFPDLFFILFSRKFFFERLYCLFKSYFKVCINAPSYLLFLFSRRPRVIYHYWFSPNIIISYLFRIFLSFSGSSPQVISRLHRFDIFEDQSPFSYLPFFRFSKHVVSHFYTLGSYSKSYLSNYFRIPAHKISISRLGASFSSTIKHKDTSSSVINILSISTVTSVKRVSLIAESLAYLSDQLDNCQVIWHHFGDGSLFSGLHLQVDRLMLNRQHFSAKLHGFLSPSLLDSFLTSKPFAFCINLSLSEGTPHSLIKAASFNIPLIATDVGDTSEICNQSTGFLLSPSLSSTEIAFFIKSKLPYLLSMKDDLSVRDFALRNFDADSNFSLFYKSL